MITWHITIILFPESFASCLGERQAFRILFIYHIESLPMSSFQTILLSLVITDSIAFPLVKNSFVNSILLYNHLVSNSVFGFSKNTDNELWTIPLIHPSDAKWLWYVDRFLHFIIIKIEFTHPCYILYRFYNQWKILWMGFIIFIMVYKDHIIAQHIAWNNQPSNCCTFLFHSTLP